MSAEKDSETQEFAEEFEEERPEVLQGCGILGRYPILSVLFFAAAGIGLGIGLAAWEPDDSNNKDVLIKWLGLVGDMFVRSLSKCSS